MQKQNVKWHKMTAKAVVEQLHTNAACGLSRKAARSRSRRNSSQHLFSSQEGKLGAWSSFLHDPSVLLLLLTFALTLFFAFNFSVLGGVLVLACCAGAVFRLTQKMRGVSRINAAFRVPAATVLRDGKLYEISANEVVLGDIVLLQKGDIVPCDCRILESDGEFCTRLIFLDTNGKRTAVDHLKDHATLYRYEDEISAPYCKNMVYGKSEVIAGYARGVAVAIGEYTFMGALGQEQRKEEGNNESTHTIAGGDRMIRLYSTLLTVVLIPLCFISFFTAPAEYDILQIFLPLCALCGVGAQSVLCVFFDAILTQGYMKCIESKDRTQKYAVPKSIRTFQRISDVNEVLVIGKSASSDGILHVHRAAVGNEELILSNSSSQLSLRPICEVYELLWHALSLSIKGTESQHCYDLILYAPAVRDELFRISRFDRKALQIRMKDVALHHREDGIAIDARFQEGNARFVLTDRKEVLAACTGYEKEGSVYQMDASARNFILSFASSASAECGRVIYLIRISAGRTVLLGALSLREAVQPALPSVIEELSRSGVNVRFFLSNEGELTERYIQTAKLPTSVLYADSLRDETEIFKCYSKYRVFVGFSNQMIKKILRALRANSKTTAVISDDPAFSGAFSESDLRISAIPDFHPENRIEGGAHILEQSTSAPGRRVMDHHAHLLLSTANENGGGLFSLLHALSCSRESKLLMSILFRFLLVSNLLLTATVGISAILGVGTLTAAQILLCGWGMDLFFVFRVLRIRVSQKHLRKKHVFDELFCKKVIGEKHAWLSSCVAMALICIISFVLRLTGQMEAGAVGTFLFLSNWILQCILMIRLMRSDEIRQNFRSDLIYMSIFAFPILILFFLSCIFTSIGAVTGMVALPLWGYPALLIGPCAEYGFLRLAHRKMMKKRTSCSD